MPTSAPPSPPVIAGRSSSVSPSRRTTSASTCSPFTMKAAASAAGIPSDTTICCAVRPAAATSRRFAPNCCSSPCRRTLITLPSPSARVPLSGERTPSALPAWDGAFSGRPHAASHLRAPLSLADPAMQRTATPVRGRPDSKRKRGRRQRQPYEVGTEAKIVAESLLPNGRSYIVTRGERRFAVESLIVDAEPYLVGRVRYLDEPDGDRAT